MFPKERRSEHLSIALWALVILVGLNFLPEQFPSSESFHSDEYNNFHDWPIQKADCFRECDSDY